MPLFFASNAIYPISVMPRWLQFISRVNPLTYLLEALRALMLKGVPSPYGIGMDFGVLAAVTALLVVLGGRLYPAVV
jgi:ABC-2 type transport system permease protein